MCEKPPSVILRAAESLIATPAKARRAIEVLDTALLWLVVGAILTYRGVRWVLRPVMRELARVWRQRHVAPASAPRRAITAYAHNSTVLIGDLLGRNGEVVR